MRENKVQMNRHSRNIAKLCLIKLSQYKDPLCNGIVHQLHETFRPMLHDITITLFTNSFVLYGIHAIAISSRALRLTRCFQH